MGSHRLCLGGGRSGCRCSIGVVVGVGVDGTGVNVAMGSEVGVSVG